MFHNKTNIWGQLGNIQGRKSFTKADRQQNNEFHCEQGQVV